MVQKPFALGKDLFPALFPEEQELVIFLVPSQVIHWVISSILCNQEWTWDSGLKKFCVLFPASKGPLS